MGRKVIVAAKPRSDRRGWALSGLLGRAARAALCLLTWTPLVCSSAAVAGAAQKRHVLILNSYHQGFAWSDAIVQGVQSVFEESALDVELHVEYMDTKRHKPESLFGLLEKLYRQKHRHDQFDVIISSDNNALSFLLARREALFPGVPIVFCGIDYFRDSLIAGQRGITGVVEEHDLKGTIEIALRLHPRTRRVAVISDITPSGQILLERFAKLKPQLRSDVEFIELADVTVPELSQALRRLGDDALVLHLSYYRDREGRALSWRESIALVARNCNLPIYTAWDYKVGSGVVGGVVTSGRLQGLNAARMAARILRGESVDAIPILRKSPNVPMFDYVQLRRFGINPSDLPAGSIVINRPGSFYARHKTLVWSVASVIGGLTALVGLLAVNAVRRRHAEATQRALFEGVPDAVFVHDEQGRILHCNQVACRRLGYSRSELLATTTRDIDEPAFAQGFAQRLRSQLAEGRYSCEGVHVAKDGRLIPVDINTSSFTYRGRTAVLAVCRDITQRKQAERELKYRMEFELVISKICTQFVNLAADEIDGGIHQALKTVGEFARVDRSYIFLFSDGGRRMDNTHEWCAEGIEPQAPRLKALSVDQFGWLMERMRRLETIHVPRVADLPPEAAAEKADFQTGSVRSLVCVPMVCAGSLVGIAGFDSVREEKTWSEDIIALLRIVGEVLASALERKRAEEALKRSEERYALAQKVANVGSWERDIRSGHLYWSEQVEPMFGLGRGQFAGTYEAFLECVHPDDRQRVVESASACVEKGRDYDIEHRIVWPDGTVRWVAETGNVIRDDSGGAIRTAGIVRDITESKRAAEERRKLEARVQHAQKLESLGVLAGGIAHDFNNLLVGMLGNADLALMELSPVSPARQSVEEIKKAAIRASELTGQMLAYSGKGRFVIQSIRLNELVEEMAHLLEVSISKKILLRYDFADDLPAIEADAAQIRQIVMNLITNASDAIGDRSGVITIATGVMDVTRGYLAETVLPEDLPEGPYAFLEVRDTGCGMDADTKARIFDPFFTTKFAGRGLGLAAVLGIVRGHRGAIRVDSQPDEGTTCTVLFPSSQQALGVLADEEDADSIRAWKGSGTVLVADDEETVRTVAKMMLEWSGFTVRTAADGQEAVEVFRRHADEIVAVLLDMTMPRMDGEDAFRRMRAIRNDVKVILSSGYGEPEATGRFAAKGLAGFIQKPYQLEALIRKLREVLESPGRDAPES